jgi:hypothetical protein
VFFPAALGTLTVPATVVSLGKLFGDIAVVTDNQPRR